MPPFPTAGRPGYRPTIIPFSHSNQVPDRIKKLKYSPLRFDKRTFLIIFILPFNIWKGDLLSPLSNVIFCLDEKTFQKSCVNAWWNQMAGCIFASASGEQAERMKRKRKEGQDGAGCFEIFLITFLNLIWRCGNELVPLRPAFEGFDLGGWAWVM